MRLLNVEAFLDRETNIGRATPATKVLEERDDATTAYAILSHRWGDEVNYNEINELTRTGEEEREKIRARNGYKKILGSCRQTMKDGLQWLWVDTCCIDKRSSSELSEAINSMYRWYENSAKCYAYLHDVDSPTFVTEPDHRQFNNSNGWPEWFSRGWTLQELIAPRDVQYFNEHWVPIGSKRNLADTLEKITRIPQAVLINGLASGVRSAAQVMSWAADRKTTRVEDRAYSLMGLFGVHMPMLYGEGKSAFHRLQLEIVRSSNDHSIFAWDPKGRIRRSGSILADDPSYFRDCNGIWSVKPDWFVPRFKSRLQDHLPAVRRVMPANLIQSVLLTLLGQSLVRELSTFSITNGGIQISLPLAPYPNSPSLFRATLRCKMDIAAPLMTIDLLSDSTVYYRFFGATGEPTVFPRIKQLFLSCDQDESRHSLTLDDRTVSYYGFTRCGTFPRSISGNSVKLSLSNDLIVIIYANDNANVRFAVGLGYYLRNAWVHSAYDETRVQTCTPWEDYAKQVYDWMWTKQADLARSMPGRGTTADTSSDSVSFIKHTRLPRSIWAVRTMWGNWPSGNCTVTIDVAHCAGCCNGPLEWKTLVNDWDGLDTPGPMQMAGPLSPKYVLYLDGTYVQFLKSTYIGIMLGDYGRFDSTFKRDGNIFQDLESLAEVLCVDPTDPAYRPVQRSVSGGNAATKEEDTVIARASGDSSSRLILRQPIGLSLPNNQPLVSLLKALSTRLTNKCLVTSVVRCAVQPGQTVTRLCYFSTPQVWHAVAPNEVRLARFKEIREQFYILLNWRQPATSASSSRSLSGKMINGAIKYFSDLFGIEHFKNYVGKTTFFNRLSSLDVGSPTHSPEDIPNSSGSQPESSNDPSSMASGPSVEREEPEVAQNSSINALVRTLRRRMDRASTRHRKRMQEVKRELGAISQTLGIRLLEEISAVYAGAHDILYPLHDNLDRRYFEYDTSKPLTEFVGSLDPQTDVSGHDGIQSMVREIKSLQAVLDVTTDIGERCALEEDITGKILWTCHCGLRFSVGHIPAKVLYSILKEDKVYDVMNRISFLEEISKVFKDALAALPSDDHTHLRRIMADAEAGTSKHRQLFDARTQELRIPGATREG